MTKQEQRQQRIQDRAEHYLRKLKAQKISLSLRFDNEPPSAAMQAFLLNLVEDARGKLIDTEVRKLALAAFEYAELATENADSQTNDATVAALRARIAVLEDDLSKADQIGASLLQFTKAFRAKNSQQIHRTGG